MHVDECKINTTMNRGVHMLLHLRSSAYDCGRSEETHIDPGLIHTYQHHDLSGWLQGSKALLIQSCVRTGCGILWVCCVGACEGDVMGDRQIKGVRWWETPAVKHKTITHETVWQSSVVGTPRTMGNLTMPIPRLSHPSNFSFGVFPHRVMQ